jgi:hypothetical protein
MAYLITFGSTHKALKAEKILKEKNIPFKLIPTPKALATFCDLSLSFQEQDREAVENTLKNAGVKTVATYRKEGDEYVKV